MENCWTGFSNNIDAGQQWYAIYLGSSIKQIPGSDTGLTIYDLTISNEELHPLIALQLELWLLIAYMAYTIKLLEVT